MTESRSLAARGWWTKRRERVNYINYSSTDVLEHQQASKWQSPGRSKEGTSQAEAYKDAAAQGRGSAGSHCQPDRSSASKLIKRLGNAEGAMKKYPLKSQSDHKFDSRVRLPLGEEVNVSVLLICLPNLMPMHPSMESQTLWIPAGKEVWQGSPRFASWATEGRLRSRVWKSAECQQRVSRPCMGLGGLTKFIGLYIRSNFLFS